jgi:chemotaxis methyl-accepting protein methylase
MCADTAQPPSGDHLFSEFPAGVENTKGFFREQAFFDVLTSQVFPTIIRNVRPPNAIRIWVPACGQGQEAYSLTMALIEYLERASARVAVQIFAKTVVYVNANNKPRYRWHQYFQNDGQ